MASFEGGIEGRQRSHELRRFEEADLPGFGREHAEMVPIAADATGA